MSSTIAIEQILPLKQDSSDVNNEQSNHIILSSRWIRLLLIAAAVKSILGLIILFLLFLISLIVFIIALHFRHSTSCPIEPKISLFLIVASVVSTQWLILSAILSTITIIQKDFHSFVLVTFNILTAVVIIAINLFLMVWLILGGIWTLRALDSVQYINPHLPTFCELTLYRLTLGYLTFTYMLSALQCWYRLCVVIFCSIQKE